MRFIELHKITADRPARPEASSYTDTDEPGEPGAAVDTADTVPCSVSVAAIRCFYPRKDNRVGTRLTFTDGGGFAVTEPYDEVARLLTAAIFS
jgi:hypothetical protein